MCLLVGSGSRSLDVVIGRTFAGVEAVLDAAVSFASDQGRRKEEV